MTYASTPAYMAYTFTFSSTMYSAANCHFTADLSFPRGPVTGKLTNSSDTHMHAHTHTLSLPHSKLDLNPQHMTTAPHFKTCTILAFGHEMLTNFGYHLPAHMHAHTHTLSLPHSKLDLNPQHMTTAPHFKTCTILAFGHEMLTNFGYHLPAQYRQLNKQCS